MAAGDDAVDALGGRGREEVGEQVCLSRLANQCDGVFIDVLCVSIGA